MLRARSPRQEVRRRQGPGRQTNSCAPARQHVGAAVEQDLPGHSRALQGRRQPQCRCRAGQAGLRRQADDAIGGAVLRLARVSQTTRDVLGTFDADASTRSRSRVSRERVAHGRQARRAHQAVHHADRGRSRDDLSRAGSRVLQPVVRGSALPVSERRARRLPRSDRRHRGDVDDAGVPAPDQPGWRCEDLA